MTVVEQPIVMVKRLSKSFGRKMVLNQVTFSMMTGHVVGLVGPNGAGKTTIMKALLGLFNWQQGEIIIDGTKITQQYHATLSQTIGALIEQPALYPFLTGWQHLQLVTSVKPQLDWIIAELHLASFIHQSVRQYSLGMRQKLGIALALVERPRLVILDEPMNGLDPQSVKQLRELLKRLAKSGTTILISSHILSELEKVIDDIVLIDDGQVILECNLRKLQAGEPTRLELQTGDNDRATTILTQLGYVVSKKKMTIEVQNVDDCQPMLTVLANKHIWINHITEKQLDLETAILQVLTERGRMKA